MSSRADEIKLDAVAMLGRNDECADVRGARQFTPVSESGLLRHDARRREVQPSVPGARMNERYGGGRGKPQGVQRADQTEREGVCDRRAHERSEAEYKKVPGAGLASGRGEGSECRFQGLAIFVIHSGEHVFDRSSPPRCHGLDEASPVLGEL